jgi:peptidoglycan/LPS O-acetylase OafA/YrhL
MPLTPAFSAYLDCLRFFAALCVLLGHLTQDGFALAWLPLSHLSHEAVVVFFFMSGYIITASTVSRPEQGALDYAVARVSRIYSVALPAVLFCVLLAFAIGHWNPPLAASIASYEEPNWRNTLLSLLFLNESWSRDSRVTLNGPYWSLCYEVWYYAIFGLWFFAKGRWRWPLTLGAMAIAGPAVLALFPIWVLGAWLALNPSRLPKPSGGLAWLVWLVAPALIWMINVSGIEQVIKSALHNSIPGFWRLEASQRLFTDFAIALLLAAHLWAWSGLPSWLHEVWQRRAAFWAAWAGFSFTLYLFHRPFTTVIAKWLGEAAGQLWLSLLMVVGSVFVCWLIAFATERQLPRWRRAVRVALTALLPGARPAPT